jgi:hypothetical protein
MLRIICILHKNVYNPKLNNEGKIVSLIFCS